jgi:hypothetical protein
MGSDWDLILARLDGLQRDATRIGEVIVSLSTEMDQTRDAFEQVRAELNKTKKQAATLKSALTPPQIRPSRIRPSRDCSRHDRLPKDAQYLQLRATFFAISRQPLRDGRGG